MNLILCIKMLIMHGNHAFPVIANQHFSGKLISLKPENVSSAPESKLYILLCSIFPRIPTMLTTFVMFGFFLQIKQYMHY